MMAINSPKIYEVTYDNNFGDELKKINKKDKDIIQNFPTAYIIYDFKNSKYNVYVGETNDIKNRTLQHLDTDPNSRDDFAAFLKSKTSKMFVIGHDHFNKSLTMDIENRLIHYLSSLENVETNNRRSNQQGLYYPDVETDEIFSKIWRKLTKVDKNLFPLESVIKDSAIFKSSPFHKLTEEQLDIREQVILKVTSLLTQNKENQLIVIEGEAGSGKTVLLSSLFYELNQLSKDKNIDPVINEFVNNVHLLVNHEEQLKVYKQISEKLGISKKGEDIVSKPTRFINNTSPKDKADVVIIDEAHLLWTQGKQAYRGDNQLEDILNRSKIVIAVLDPHQILSREQYLSQEQYAELIQRTHLENSYFRLNNQLRINASEKTVKWIRTLVDEGKIDDIPKDLKYDVKIFKNPESLYKQIRKKALNETNGISRLLATFDWPYNNTNKPLNDDYWNVEIDNFKLPWNLQLKTEKKFVKKSWAEQPQTIGEVGSTFTIQGFDLNYAGVIIGPSVKYRNGKIIFDKNYSKNSKATKKRTLDSGEKKDISDSLLKNELNVLLTRGVNGLYIYAVDPELRNALLNSQKSN